MPYNLQFNKDVWCFVMCRAKNSEYIFHTVWYISFDNYEDLHCHVEKDAKQKLKMQSENVAQKLKNTATEGGMNPRGKLWSVNAEQSLCRSQSCQIWGMVTFLTAGADIT